MAQVFFSSECHFRQIYKRFLFEVRSAQSCMTLYSFYLFSLLLPSYPHRSRRECMEYSYTTNTKATMTDYNSHF
jgi:hypothetical protein